MTFDSFLERLAEGIEGLEPATITPDTLLADIPQWDSLAVLTTINECEMAYGVSLSPSELQGYLTAGELYARVKSKRGGE